MSTYKKRPWMRLLIAAILLLVVAGALRTYWIYKHPLVTHGKKARRMLATAGLEKVEAQLAGDRLVYWQGGEGQTLVLLHGAGDHAGTWAEIVPALLEEHRLLIPDLPGHGGSEPSEGPLPMDEVLSGLEALLEAEGEDDQPILVGNSMGAWLATIYAHRHPARVRRIVLVNGGALTINPESPSLTPVDREAARQLMDLLRDPSSPKIPDFVLDDIVRRAASGPIGRMLQDMDSLVRHFLDGRLGEVETPVDLVWGESDRLMDLDYAERMLAELPRARLTGVPTCGHIPHNECPQRFVEILTSVLDTEPPTAEAAPEPPIDEESSQEEVGGASR